MTRPGWVAEWKPAVRIRRWTDEDGCPRVSISGGKSRLPKYHKRGK